MTAAARTSHRPPTLTGREHAGRTVRQRRDEGGASVEFVVAAPVLVLLLMLIVQFAVWAHATHIAQAAADEGAQAGRLYLASAGDANAASTVLLDQSAGTILADRTVTVSRTATTITVTITGTAATVVPGLRLPVQVSVTSPIERVTTAAVPAFALAPEERM